MAAIGVMVGGYLMATVLFRPSGACLAFGNLYYGVSIDAAVKPVSPFVYAAVVLLPFAVSSMRGAKLLAIAVAVSFTVAGIFYRVGFASVWCFFAAALSGIVVLVVRRNRDRRGAVGVTADGCRAVDSRDPDERSRVNEATGFRSAQ